jgi:CDP-paratose 2-epimerase
MSPGPTISHRGGAEWFDWLIPTLRRRFELLPCVHYTPPSLSRTGRTTGAPRDLGLCRLHRRAPDPARAHFSHVELWNEPNNLLDWDWREDEDYLLFCEMAGAAAYWVRERGWKAVLGGPCPFDPYWLDLMGERGLLAAQCAAVGFHGFPGTWDSEEASWRGWDMHLGEMRAILDRWNPDAEIWITETGYSTWRGDEMEQARRFAQALETPADRLYWYGWQDLPPMWRRRRGSGSTRATTTSARSTRKGARSSSPGS